MATIDSLAAETLCKIMEMLKERSPRWDGIPSPKGHPIPGRQLEASDTANLRTILDAFPSPATLTHLSIGTDDFSSLEHIITLLGHPTLTLLARLDLPSLPAIAPIEQASAVAAMGKACEDRGIRWSMGGTDMRMRVRHSKVAGDVTGIEVSPLSPPASLDQFLGEPTWLVDALTCVQNAEAKAETVQEDVKDQALAEIARRYSTLIRNITTCERELKVRAPGTKALIAYHIDNLLHQHSNYKPARAAYGASLRLLEEACDIYSDNEALRAVLQEAQRRQDLRSLEDEEEEYEEEEEECDEEVCAGME
ncbi:hypothetical protein RQP46_003216 [Phenoliferia psychrophenolica]